MSETRDNERLGSATAPERVVRRLRLLIVAPSFDILGGQTVQAARLIEKLQQEPSMEVEFLPINPRLPGILRTLQRIRYLRTLVTSLLYVATLLAKVRKYDIVHVFSASYFSFVLAPTPAILIARLYGKKVLLNYHSGEAEDHLERWKRTAIPTIKMADVVVVPSDYLVRIFSKFGLAAHAIHNIIDLESFPFRERQPLRPIFLSNRNFEKHYGVDLVLRSFSLIQAEVAGARLIVAGDGPERSALERLATELKLNAKFVGRINHEQIADIYNQADIFLNASAIDNQPLSILEAFACGLPVVTTSAGGIVDMITHEKNGLLVPCGDYEQLARSATRLLEDAALVEQLTRTAQLSCREYAWNTVRERWLTTYHGVAEPTSAASLDGSEPTPGEHSRTELVGPS